MDLRDIWRQATNRITIATSNGGKAGEKIAFRVNGQRYTGRCAQQIAKGKCLALLANGGQWWVINTQPTRPPSEVKRVLSYRKQRPPVAVVAIARLVELVIAFDPATSSWEVYVCIEGKCTLAKILEPGEEPTHLDNLHGSIAAYNLGIFGLSYSRDNNSSFSYYLVGTDKANFFYTPQNSAKGTSTYNPEFSRQEEAYVFYLGNGFYQSYLQDFGRVPSTFGTLRNFYIDGEVDEEVISDITNSDPTPPFNSGLRPNFDWILKYKFPGGLDKEANFTAQVEENRINSVLVSQTQTINLLGDFLIQNTNQGYFWESLSQTQVNFREFVFPHSQSTTFTQNEYQVFYQKGEDAIAMEVGDYLYIVTEKTLTTAEFNSSTYTFSGSVFDFNPDYDSAVLIGKKILHGIRFNGDNYVIKGEITNFTYTERVGTFPKISDFSCAVQIDAITLVKECSFLNVMISDNGNYLSYFLSTAKVSLSVGRARDFFLANGVYPLDHFSILSNSVYHYQNIYDQYFNSGEGAYDYFVLSRLWEAVSRDYFTGNTIYRVADPSSETKIIEEWQIQGGKINYIKSFQVNYLPFEISDRSIVKVLSASYKSS